VLEPSKATDPRTNANHSHDLHANGALPDGADAQPALSLGRDVKPHETAVRAGLVEQILAINTSASPEFLSRFTSRQLRAYLEHLSLAGARGNRPWIRPERTPAVVCYRAGA
jgi:hypothetical protein